jgi:outer membrane protein OmpA-like peptidoglycan-associated protein
MMRLAVIFLFLPLCVFSQNLVMNAGFEDENICTEYSMNCAPDGWISNCFAGNYYFRDVHYSAKGEHFVGIPLNGPGRTDVRYFIRTRLLCGLRKDARYRIDFFIRSAHRDLDSIGISFYERDPLYEKQSFKKLQPDFWLVDLIPAYETRQDNWFLASVTYTAKGNENFFTFGDYKRSPHKLPGKPDLQNNYYYFIDEVYIGALNSQEKMCASADSVKRSEYDINERHNLMQKQAYVYSKNPPPVGQLPKTILQRIDTLVIPDVLFATNSYRLNRNAGVLLDSFIHAAGKLVIDSLVVEGHTDSMGSHASNEILSLNRARAVAEYLQPYVKQGIRTAGWASDRPVADNKTTEGRQKNRRVEIYLYVRE